MGGRENVGREDGVKRDESSSAESGSGGSIGRYFFRTEAIVVTRADGGNTLKKDALKGRASLFSPNVIIL